MNSKQNLRGFATVNYFAADHAGAKKWYSDLLGMEPYFDKPGYFEFRIGDYQAELGIIDSQYMPTFDMSQREPTGQIIYWHVDDLQATLDDLIARGATPLHPITERGSGFVTASVVDPFGNILGIMYNPHYVEILGEEKA